MSEILVRAAEISDAEAIAAIMSCPGVIAGTLQLPLRSIDDRRRYMAETAAQRHRLVAELDGRVVGTASLMVESPARRGHAAGIGMAVHDDF